MLVTGLVLRIVDTSGASGYIYDKHSEVRACVHVRSAQKAPHEEMASPAPNGGRGVICWTSGFYAFTYLKSVCRVIGGGRVG